jgi:hypothetical protein
MSAFEIKPSEDYKKSVNETTGEVFPNCCPFHKAVLDGAKNWLKKFPNCCAPHRAMASKWWFVKSNYDGLPEKVINQLSYTEQHIIAKIGISEWYKDITDYIEWNVLSFGQPAIGVNLYLDRVKERLRGKERLIQSPERAERLIEYINSFNNPTEKSKNIATDLNILYSTYQKWLSIFPFDLSYFSHLKEGFDHNLPILNGSIEINSYSKLAKAKLHTRSSLIDSLINLTDQLLTKINGLALFEKGLITDADKIKLELIISSRKMKINKGYTNNSKNEEQRYRRILKEWFKDEKEFIDEIKPLLKIQHDSPAKPKPEEDADQSKPTLTAYAIMHVYLSMFNGQGVTQQNKNALATKYGYTSGDRLRNDFTKYQNEGKRLDLSTTNKKSADTHLERFKKILLKAPPTL